MNLQPGRVHTALAATATILSGAAFYFGTGLHPLWPLMWVAPLPVLLLSPRIPWSRALLVAFVARLLGAGSMVTYLRVRLNQVPVETRLAYLLIPVFVFTLAVMLSRAFFRRGQFWPAILAFPSTIVAYEYCSSLWGGTYWNTAYTQLDNLPVLQLAAVTGLWGISSVVLLFSSALAVILLTRDPVRRRLVATLTGTIVCVVGYGAWRLVATPATHSIVMGLVSTAYPGYVAPFAESPEMQLAVLQQYASEARQLGTRGAQIVVLPEMMTLVQGPYSYQVDQLFEETAREANAQVLLDVLHATAGRTFNEARLYSAAGGLEAVYRKHHPAYVLGENVTPGTGISVLDRPEGILGLAVCSDMDYLNPARIYGRRKVGVLLVPAWDSSLDESWHGHMAIMRGVENGYSIVRSSKVGLLTVSDDRGRILAETSAHPNTHFTTMLTTVPVRHDQTVYQVLGDWFAWLNLAVFSGLVAWLFTRWRCPASN
ncbi:MAG TPA: nitrilase-related carbon-nitrogen hydrolase [Edaphobacter sp.]|uniref:nitrilase-related carbon-nitrogen hydrolase n=1 Tax=Edaphobacter sp. TaxID=1934404 RepID=UPI002CCC41AE|nr:nitrilase-related carbon-nitrogen hydrolase [Edaphobacter sp.]HUZ93951.1 nitrilase-related carbon-nitrogen hydrolase [Edaphobacter sp.]